MRRRLILLPGAFEGEGEAPAFERIPDEVRPMFERGQTMRIVAAPTAVPEAEWLGLNPQSADAAPGPLLVAALGAHPPERSVAFQLSVLSTDGSAMRPIAYEPSFDELGVIRAAAMRLETSRLKVVEGRGLDWGLVWEDGSIELGCRTPEEAAELGWEEARPVGDGEPMLRRFIDDSVNLLSETEMNAIRIEEGLPPLNVLWPWGPGFTPQLPNLTTERGLSVRVESSSPRLAGLARLAGYRAGDPWSLGKGTNLRLESMASTAKDQPAWLAVIPEIGEFRAKGQVEEANWLAAEVMARLAAPMVRDRESAPVRIVLAATGQDGVGLAVEFSSGKTAEAPPLPFRSEVAHDRKGARKPLHELVAEALTL